MIRRPPRSTQSRSSAASDVYKRQVLCRIAQVSRSGYYHWLGRADEPEKDHHDYLVVKEIFDNGRGKYGWKTIRMKLEDKGIIFNHKKIIRIKNKYGLITKIRQKNPY